MTDETTDKGEGKGSTGNNRLVVLCCAAFVSTMVGVSFAAVPLYQLFCQVTGYAGTTQRADAGGDVVLDKEITVRFDANLGGHLPWSFKPDQNSVKVKIGAMETVYYRVRNLADHDVTATATFNVTPGRAGLFFSKIACFCFTEQTLKAGEELQMGVTFYVDPAIVDDKEAKYVDTITLSYTFFPVKGSETPLAAAPRPQSASDGS
ncbi:cytochrome c oxidase assembly protein [Methylobrevis pamukkalensis]|uniref:Cytochrome c oxidase assembly protein CtaG n=1 Tax=Methylobrevis pamukkalensis TaxID=1439726 RepID=A0A1E3H5P8_9HYPH|nr:cytochrome c oxidase assembly protein [Methylobrevis pamukkalensis]ODN71633.1 Cytochrome c oxidase assembly protein CtaG [Methylobrevis pamukkalensis]